jgi:hypothetical protein
VARAINRIRISPPLMTDRLRVVMSRGDGGAVGITALQAWRQPDPRVSAGFTVPSLAVDAGRTVTVQARVTGPVTRTSLQVPRGWTARSVGATTWQVSLPADADPTAGLPVRLLAWSRDGVTSALLPTRYQFDPADYPTVTWDDDFSTDRLAAYRIDHPAAEPSPRLAVGDGVLTASADARAFAVLAAPAPGAGAASGAVVVVEPDRFSGASPEDSLFLGFSAGDGDNALAWYNNHYGSSGVDVRVGGVAQPASTGGCCAAFRWSADDRFAVLSRWGKLTTWVEHDGKWALIHTAPVSPTGSPAFGLRLDGGTMALDRVTVRSR